MPLESLPAEILHGVCANIPIETIPAVRLVNKRFSEVGKHYLIEGVTFFLTEQSLNRLLQIASDPVFAYQITQLQYHANLFREIEDFEQYRDAMVHDHPRTSYPVLAAANPTPRELRVHIRNMEKYYRGDNPWTTRQIDGKIRTYAQMCAAQKALLEDGTEQRILADVLKRLPHLKQLIFLAAPTCCHLLPPRLMEHFQDLRITPPTKRDTAQTVGQIANLLNPLMGTNVKLQSLRLSYISPEILAVTHLSSQLPTLKQNFAKIIDCNLEFKLDAAREKRLREGDTSANSYKILHDGGLPLLLSTMPRLRELSVVFDDCSCMTKIPLKHIIGGNTWKRLKSLTLSNFSATEDSMINLMKKHRKALREFRFHNASLTKGSWTYVAEWMRLHMDLRRAEFTGMLRQAETGEEWEMNSANAELWAETEGEYTVTLTNDLHEFICKEYDPVYDSDDEGVNPLELDDMYIPAAELNEGMEDFDEMYGF